MISTLAYQYSRTAPKVTKPRPNVNIMLCSIEEDRSRPIATAEVRLSRDGQDVVTVTDADGRFALEQLTPGEWRARVSTAGHVSERFMVTIPQRGELRGVHIDLVPVREKVWSMYRRAAQPKLPCPDL